MGHFGKNDHSIMARDTQLPPVVRLADIVMVEAIKSGSSDIHLEPCLDGVAVRYRIDGALEERFRFPKWVQNPLIARFKALARLDITGRRVPQDGRIQLKYLNGTVDLRVSSLPGQHGEKITLRILDATRGVKTLDELGLSPTDLQRVRECQQQLAALSACRDAGPAGALPQQDELRTVIEQLHLAQRHTEATVRAAGEQAMVRVEEALRKVEEQAAAQRARDEGTGDASAKDVAERDALRVAVQKCEQRVAALAVRLEASPAGDLSQLDELRRTIEQVQLAQYQAEAAARAAGNRRSPAPRRPCAASGSARPRRALMTSTRRTCSSASPRSATH